jgi:hypothetical protein
VWSSGVWFAAGLLWLAVTSIRMARPGKVTQPGNHWRCSLSASSVSSANLRLTFNHAYLVPILFLSCFNYINQSYLSCFNYINQSGLSYFNYINQSGLSYFNYINQSGLSYFNIVSQLCLFYCNGLSGFHLAFIRLPAGFHKAFIGVFSVYYKPKTSQIARILKS